jgi:hypothetical protein
MDYPEYLNGPDRSDYGFLPAFLLAVPAWAWITGGALATTAAVGGGSYLYGKSSGSEEAAQRAAAAQAAAAPAPGTYYPINPMAPGLPTDPSQVNPNAQPWYKDARYLVGGAVVLAALVLAYRASSPRGRTTVVEESE